MEPGKEAAASPTSGVQSGLEEQKYPAFSENENRNLAKNGESQEKNGAPNDFMETKAVALAERIWAYIRDRLTLQYPYFHPLLWSFVFQPMAEDGPPGTDGRVIYYHASWVCRHFQQNPEKLADVLLHMLYHCLLGHLHPGDEIWNLACDEAVHAVMTGSIGISCAHHRGRAESASAFSAGAAAKKTGILPGRSLLLGSWRGYGRQSAGHGLSGKNPVQATAAGRRREEAGGEVLPAKRKNGSSWRSESGITGAI